MIYVKDESKRFGLNAFKGLGGSYGIGRYLGEQLGLSPKTLTYNDFTAKSVRRKLKGLTVVTATDGNHGRGVAWRRRSWVLTPLSTCLKAAPRSG